MDAQMKVANHVLEYRREQEAKLATGHHKCGEPLALGDVCTMNLTVLKVGRTRYALCTLVRPLRVM